MKFNTRPISLAAMFCVSLLSSCTSNIEMPLPPLSPSSSSAAGQKSYCIYPEIQQCYYGTYSVCPAGGIPGNSCPYSSSSSIQNGQSSSGAAAPEYGYCVFASDRMCLDGPVSVCPSGGIPGNSCPYSSSGSGTASSSSLGGSSSSVRFPSSSSLAPPSSSAAAPSSSGGCVSSGSYYCELPPVGSLSSSSVPSSSSVAAGSSTSLSGTSSTFTDNRDSKVYKWVKIGTQTWMAENLNYNATDSKCYNNQDSYCNTYGRLYDWSTAMAVCPSDWHLPSKEEWDALTTYVQSNKGCSNCDAKHLKATNGWNSSGNGLDAYGFSALPGGEYHSGSFGYAGSYGNWWSASKGYFRNMYYGYDRVEWHDDDMNRLISVRCLKD